MGRCPRCNGGEAALVKRVDSKTLDYHVDIFRCDKCEAYLVSTCAWEHSPLEAIDTFKDALEFAKECVRAQEGALDEEEEERNCRNCVYCRVSSGSEEGLWRCDAFPHLWMDDLEECRTYAFNCPQYQRDPRDC